MRIKTERLALTELCTEHYPGACRYSLDPDNTRMMCFLPCDDGEEVRRYLEKCEEQWNKELPDYLDAAVLLNDVHIGSVSIELLDHHTVGELGWIIEKTYWGNGYAGEAAAAWMRYVSERFGIRKYIAHCDEANAASRRVMEKLGMTLTAVTFGRKNRGTNELCHECTYEMMYPYS